MVRRIEYDHVPAGRLEPAPSEGGVEPPVTPRSRELPFDKLRWQDFEALCLQLALAQADVDHCIAYGTEGEGQEGIDLFGWRDHQEPVVYQCKRYTHENFRPSDLDAAVALFLDTAWAQRARRFVFCSPVQMRTRARAEALERARQVLERRSIAFEPWESTQLSRMLKDEPKIVDDFFGRGWVEAFNGEEAAIELRARWTRAARAAARDSLKQITLSELRNADIYDSPADGLPAFVVPRLVVRDLRPRSRAGDPDGATESGAPRLHAGAAGLVDVVHRTEPMDGWLSRGSRCLLLGDPGLGKSTLVRRIAHDLASGGGEFERCASRWTDRVPVALRLPALVSRFPSSSGTEELLSATFASSGGSAAAAVLNPALRARSVVLLIDGADETADDATANAVMTAIDVWAGPDTPIIVAGRGSVTGWFGPGWQRAELGALDREQQRQLIAQTGARDEHARSGFFAELDARPEVATIAGVPMYLRFAYREWSRGRTLPTTASQVLRDLVSEVLEQQPRRRTTPGGRPSRPVGVDLSDLRQALAAFACHLHSAAAVASRGGALAWWRERLGRDVGAAALDWCVEAVGILRGNDTVGFAHRAVQERLTGEAVAEMTSDQRREHLTATVELARWGAVWPHVTATLSVDEAGDFLAELSAARERLPAALHLDVAILDCVAELGVAVCHATHN